MNPVLLSPNLEFFQILGGSVCLFLFPTFGNISGGHGYKIYLAYCLVHRNDSVSGNDDQCVPAYGSLRQEERCTTHYICFYVFYVCYFPKTLK